MRICSQLLQCSVFQSTHFSPSKQHVAEIVSERILDAATESYSLALLPPDYQKQLRQRTISNLRFQEQYISISKKIHFESY